MANEVEVSKVFNSRFLLLYSVFAVALLVGGCGRRMSAVSLSCSMEIEKDTASSHARDAIIIIESDEKAATLTWLPMQYDGNGVWPIHGQLGERCYTGVVDSDLGTHVSIDRTTGQVQITDSKEPIRRYRGTCRPLRGVFEPHENGSLKW
ncbi:hypothetical protein ACWYXJ_29280 [Janthinobacterium lividum]